MKITFYNFKMKKNILQYFIFVSLTDLGFSLAYLITQTVIEKLVRTPKILLTKIKLDTSIFLCLPFLWPVIVPALQSLSLCSNIIEKLSYRFSFLFLKQEPAVSITQQKGSIQDIYQQYIEPYLNICSSQQQ